MSIDYTGFLISLEGPDGAGKTSHIPPLTEGLRSMGLNVFPSREPGGTSISEQIRDVLHDLKNKEMHPRTETLLYQGARAQIVEEVLLPRLRAGEILILDRFYDSTIAYQGYGRQQDIGKIKVLVDYATGGLIPDLTILFNISAETGLKRKVANEVEWNRMDNNKIDFHRRVVGGYLKMAKEDPTRWKVIDASKDWQEVHFNLKREVVNSLTLNGFIEGEGRSPERR